MQCLNRISPPIHVRRLLLRHSCTQLFVGGLSYDTNESILKKAFEEYGEVIEAKVICDRVSGKSKGYGFVRYTDETAMTKALKEMNGKLLDGRNIRIHNAHRGGMPETPVQDPEGRAQQRMLNGESVKSSTTPDHA